jgi:predicted AAA+ superfamily ATPase
MQGRLEPCYINQAYHADRLELVAHQATRKGEELGHHWRRHGDNRLSDDHQSAPKTQHAPPGQISLLVAVVMPTIMRHQCSFGLTNVANWRSDANLQDMIARVLGDLVRRRLDDWPAVALVGPRQCGKTTLARSLGGVYLDLEKPEDRLRVDLDWNRLATSPELLVLDEAQTMPEVFPRLRSAIDEDRRRMGRFLVLGSVSPSLMRDVGEALTGRLAICRLTPLLAEETGWDRQEELWLMGGYPDGGIQKQTQFPVWQREYLELMAQRDLPEWGLPSKPSTTLRLFRMLAAVHGQTWNASQLGRSLSLSHHTVTSYVDILEQAFLMRRLPPFHANIRKRLVKSPKVYWRDAGLVHALLGVESRNSLLAKPWVGSSWEGWVIEQILGRLDSTGHSWEAFHMRTSDQHEIDLLVSWRGLLWAFEIKLTTAPQPHDMRRLRATAEMVGASRRALISRTSQPVRSEDEGSLDLQTALEWLTATD